MFKIIYIFTIIFFWLNWFSSAAQASDEIKKKTSLLRSFAIDVAGYVPKFRDPIPKFLLNYFKLLMFSLIPLLNIALGFLMSSENYYNELVKRAEQAYKDKFSDWLKDADLEEVFLEYMQKS